MAPSDSSCCVQPLECPYLVRARRKAAAVVTKLITCFEMIIMICMFDYTCRLIIDHRFTFDVLGGSVTVSHSENILLQDGLCRRTNLSKYKNEQKRFALCRFEAINSFLHHALDSPRIVSASLGSQWRRRRILCT